MYQFRRMRQAKQEAIRSCLSTGNISETGFFATRNNGSCVAEYFFWFIGEGSKSKLCLRPLESILEAKSHQYSRLGTPSSPSTPYLLTQASKEMV